MCSNTNYLHLVQAGQAMSQDWMFYVLVPYFLNEKKYKKYTYFFLKFNST